jgi:hypothetical protein
LGNHLDIDPTNDNPWAFWLVKRQDGSFFEQGIIAIAQAPH